MESNEIVHRIQRNWKDLELLVVLDISTEAAEQNKDACGFLE